jgi:hypothetical protein
MSSDATCERGWCRKARNTEGNKSLSIAQDKKKKTSYFHNAGRREAGARQHTNGPTHLKLFEARKQSFRLATGWVVQPRGRPQVWPLVLGPHLSLQEQQTVEQRMRVLGGLNGVSGMQVEHEGFFWRGVWGERGGGEGRGGRARKASSITITETHFHETNQNRYQSPYLHAGQTQNHGAGKDAGGCDMEAGLDGVGHTHDALRIAGEQANEYWREGGQTNKGCGTQAKQSCSNIFLHRDGSL